MPGKVLKTTELCVTVNNEVGAFAKFTLPLKQNNINIENFWAYEEGNNATFHITTNDNPKAKDWLTKAGYSVTEYPVVMWTTNNTPGEIYRATSALAESKVNIGYTYSTSVPGGNTTCCVFSTNNIDKTYETLNRL